MISLFMEQKEGIIIFFLKNVLIYLILLKSREEMQINEKQNNITRVDKVIKGHRLRVTPKHPDTCK